MTGGNWIIDMCESKNDGMNRIFCVHIKADGANNVCQFDSEIQLGKLDRLHSHCSAICREWEFWFSFSFVWKCVKHAIFHRCSSPTPQSVNLTFRVCCDNFPLNSIVFYKGIIVDHEYLGEQYETTLDQLKEVIERVIREDLRGAGLNVKYYSWSRINFNKGERNLNFFLVKRNKKAKLSSIFSGRFGFVI